MSVEADITGALAACRSDLTRVVDELKWALSTALDPGPPLDPVEIPELADDELTAAPRWATPAASPDDVPGARWALDIGDHRLRQAFLASVQLLAAAEVRTTTALFVMGTCPTQPALTRPGDHSTASSFDGCAITMRWRFDRIERDAPIAPHDKLLLVRRHLSRQFKGDTAPSARQALDQAYRHLTSAFARGKTDIATAEPMCIICGIRPRADRKSRCPTCAQWKVRNKSERPTSIDEKVIGAAKHAAERRADRNEGWGIA